MGQMQDGEGEKHGQEICCAHGVNMRWMQKEGGSYEAGLQGSLRWLRRPGWDRKQDGRHITRSEEVLTRR